VVDILVLLYHQQVGIGLGLKDAGEKGLARRLPPEIEGGNIRVRREGVLEHPEVGKEKPQKATALERGEKVLYPCSRIVLIFLIEPSLKPPNTPFIREHREVDPF
jgi:hypothetical protein